MVYMFADTETTGINPYYSEVIEAYFEVHNDKKEIIDKFHFKSQVNNWSDDSAQIHGISFVEMMKNPRKEVAWEGLKSWLIGWKDITFICFANVNTRHGNVLFDYTLIFMELMDHMGLDSMNNVPVDIKEKISVHTLAKECARGGYYKPYINPGTNSKSYRQEDVHRALFDMGYKAHNAVSDVHAMIKIYYDLKDRVENNIIQRDQLSLI